MNHDKCNVGSQGRRAKTFNRVVKEVNFMSFVMNSAIYVYFAAMAQSNYIAVIPARQGSKRLPGKNLKALMGVPLIGHTIKAALNSGLIDKVIITSDSEEILNYSSQFPVDIHPRNSSLAQDSTPTSRVLEDLSVELQKYKNVVLLQATSPLRTCDHINNAIAIYESANNKTVKSVSKTAPELSYELNGAIYIAQSAMLSIHDWDFGKMDYVAFVMEKSDSVDIDTYEDFALAEAIMKKRKENE